MNGETVYSRALGFSEEKTQNAFSQSDRAPGQLVFLLRKHCPTDFTTSFLKHLLVSDPPPHPENIPQLVSVLPVSICFLGFRSQLGKFCSLNDMYK